jgi:hypothetical protein
MKYVEAGMLSGPDNLVRQPSIEELRSVHGRSAVDGASGIFEPSRSQPRTTRDVHAAARVPPPVQ